MGKLALPGRCFIALAMIVFGLQHLIYQDFVTRVIPKLPPWMPGQAFLACLFGVFLLAAGSAILFGIEARTMALVAALVCLLSFVVLYIPRLVMNPMTGGLWTQTGKALAMAGASFLVAGSLPEKMADRGGIRATIHQTLARFIPSGRFFLAAFLIIAGIQHFIYAEFVTRFIPSWIPGPAFWTFATGTLLIAGGLGIVLPWTSRLAALLSGVMIFLWVLLIHISRATANLRDSNETTALFEALAFSGAAFLVAAISREEEAPDLSKPNGKRYKKAPDA